jgi:hypothetical protein
MNRMECSRLYDLAPELALGLLDGAERAEVLAHLEQCARCHGDVASLTEIGEQLLLLAPEVQPPAGFESRVLDRVAPGNATPQPTIPPGAWAPALSARTGQRMADHDDDHQDVPHDGRERPHGRDRDRHAGPGRRRPTPPAPGGEAEVVPLRRRFPVRTLATAAALVAVVAATAGLTLRLVGDGGGAGGGDTTFAAGEVVTVDMLTPDGRAVGSASLEAGEPATLAVDVAEWVEEANQWPDPPQGPWALEVVDHAGARERYELDDDATPEIVLDDEPAEAIATVALLDGAGRTWCTATFT